MERGRESVGESVKELERESACVGRGRESVLERE